MPSFNEPFGSCIFCDDIRSEVGGKASYMGVYYGSMHVPSFPITLAKFGIAVLWNEPIEMARARNWSVPIRVFGLDPSNSEPLIAGELPIIPEEAYALAEKSTLPSDPDVPKLMLANVVFLIAPFVIPQPGRIKVRAHYRDDYVIKLGSLRVELPLGQPAPTVSSTAPERPS